jgi:hypothetical protein
MLSGAVEAPLRRSPYHRRVREFSHFPFRNSLRQLGRSSSVGVFRLGRAPWLKLTAS